MCEKPVRFVTIPCDRCFYSVPILRKLDKLQAQRIQKGSTNQQKFTKFTKFTNLQIYKFTNLQKANRPFNSFQISHGEYTFKKPSNSMENNQVFKTILETNVGYLAVSLTRPGTNSSSKTSFREVCALLK